MGTGWMSQYLEAWSTRDSGRIVEWMTDDCVYEDVTLGETHTGREKLRAAFTKFYQSGGIKLRYCNKTDAGPITALECYMPSGRPAVAVYERGGGGKMLAARLYL